MFLHHLNERQKQGFLAMATKMVMADGTVNEHEERLMEAIKHEVGIHIKARAEEVFGETDVTVFDTRVSRLAVTAELYALGYADGKFDTAEFHVIEEVFKSFGLDDAEVKSLAQMGEAISKVAAQFRQLQGE